MTGVETGGLLCRVWFPPEPESARQVRRHLEGCLLRWGLLDRFPVEVVGLVATELFVNALKHGKQDGRAVLVVARWRGETFRVEVHDRNPQGPILTWATDQDTEGRGLVLVDALAARWGHLPKRTGGKFVFAEIPAYREGV